MSTQRVLVSVLIVALVAETSYLIFGLVHAETQPGSAECWVIIRPPSGVTLVNNSDEGDPHVVKLRITSNRQRAVTLSSEDWQQPISLDPTPNADDHYDAVLTGFGTRQVHFVLTPYSKGSPGTPIERELTPSGLWLGSKKLTFSSEHVTGTKKPYSHLVTITSNKQYVRLRFDPDQ